MSEALFAFLGRHVEVFNASVRSGDFAPLVSLFADDATLEFVGASVGPFRGRDAIAAGYAAQPPTDTMTVLAVRIEDDGTVVEPFTWSSDADGRSGEMRLIVDGEEIHRLVVEFD